MKVNAEEFGEYLRRLRKEQNLTLDALGEAAGLSKQHLSNLENGKRGIPSPEIIKYLHGPLKANFYEMMEEAGHLPKGSAEQAVLANEEQNKILEDYVDKLYKNALMAPDAAIHPQLREAIEKHIDISEDDNGLSIMKKIKDLDDLQTKEDIAFDMWMSVKELSEDEMEYILSTNEDLTYKRIALTENDRKLITHFLDALIDGRTPPNIKE